MSERVWLITGGCGFIGTTLIKVIKLSDPLALIRILDNESVGDIEDVRCISDAEYASIDSFELPSAGCVQVLVGDIRNKDDCLLAAKGVSHIVHLAANTGVQPSIADPCFDLEANVLGVVNMLEAARSASVAKFVFASSGAPIGEGEPPIHEEAVCRPISPYGASKLAGEAYCSAYYGSFGVPTIALRFSNVYGPMSGSKGSLVAKLLTRAFSGEPWVVNGDGSQTRDFIFSEDLAKAIYRGATSSVKGELFQVATGVETSVSRVVDLLTDMLASKAALHPEIKTGPSLAGDVLRNYSDISKIKRILGWEPAVSLEEGLVDTIDWFVNSRK